MAKTTKTTSIVSEPAAKAPQPPVAKATSFSISDFKVQSLILALICLVFYANTFTHEAAFDDRMAVTDNDFVQAGVAGIPDIFTKDAYQSYLEHRQGGNQLAGGRYRPLSLVTFAIEQQTKGTTHENESPDDKDKRTAEEMHSRHIVNVLLYILAAISLLYLFRTVFFPGNTLLPFIAVLLFTIHPLHTEVVANVKSRDEILSILFIALTFIKAFKYFDGKKFSDLLLTLVCFFCALLSKEYAITLVALLPLAIFIFRKQTAVQSLKTFLPCLIPLGLYLMLRFASVTSAPEGAETNILNNPYLLATGAEKIASKFLVLLQYIKLLVLPTTLAADYSYNQLPYTNFANPMVWISIALHIGIIGTTIVLIRKRHILGFALAFYLLNLALISNFLFDIGAPMGERLVFHSSVGFALIVGYCIYFGLQKLGSTAASQNATLALMVLLIALSGYKTIDRNKDWKNDETLFMTDVVKVPNSALVNNNAAAACMANAKKNKEDKKLRDEWFVKAIQYFDKTITIYPGHLNARMNRGLCYYNMGNQAEALNDWATVAAKEPQKENIQKYLTIAGKYFYAQGIKYKNNNQPDSAQFAFHLAARAIPNSPEIQLELRK